MTLLTLFLIDNEVYLGKTQKLSSFIAGFNTSGYKSIGDRPRAAASRSP
ncbi:hypothetical protein NWP21_18270 [Anabaenopsis sp. FSS-46]|nr:hypothetical protein [Anabaenopsis sp. FSS-46]MDH6100746.1 hypothetical protein [Anabaenopsis sp. FSS-46]